jgi:hypothetical protein
MPKVWNRRDISCPKDAVYVGRPTIFGNPYQIGPDGDRNTVIAKYKLFMECCLKENLGAIIKTLKGKDLVCWCAPLPCHADILLRIANEP